MKKNWIALVASLGMATNANAGYIGDMDSPRLIPKDDTLVVSGTMGGELRGSVENFKKLRDLGKKVRIEGRCQGSCVLFLAFDNVCYTSESVFNFEAPYSLRMDTPVYDAESAQKMLALMPPRLRDWLEGEGVMNELGRDADRTGTQLAELDRVDRICAEK